MRASKLSVDWLLKLMKVCEVMVRLYSLIRCCRDLLLSDNNGESFIRFLLASAQ